ncbi:conserved hypothetical protein [Gammaproteobacteria bacterium]
MSKIQEIGDRLFIVFQEGMLSGNNHRSKKPSIKELEPVARATLERLYIEADTECKKHRLWIIGRARVILYLQQKMIAAGYPVSLVRQVLFAMLISAFVRQPS